MPADILIVIVVIVGTHPLFPALLTVWPCPNDDTHRTPGDQGARAQGIGMGEKDSSGIVRCCRFAPAETCLGWHVGGGENQVSDNFACSKLGTWKSYGVHNLQSRLWSGL